MTQSTENRQEKAIVPQKNKIKSKMNMKISEVINKLQEIQKEHGDVEVMLYSYGKERAFTYYDIDYNKDDNKLYLG